jgi:hypothetical protein
MTSVFAPLNPAAAQGPTKLATPKGEPLTIGCSASIKTCWCDGALDCATLKKFANAGGCSNVQCEGDTCTCQLPWLVNKDSPVFADAERKHLVKPGMLNRLTAGQKPVKDCSASAQCGNTTITCSVKGNGLCEGINGKGISCLEFKANGDSVEHGTPCG